MASVFEDVLHLRRGKDPKKKWRDPEESLSRHNGIILGLAAEKPAVVLSVAASNYSFWQWFQST